MRQYKLRNVREHQVIFKLLCSRNTQQLVWTENLSVNVFDQLVFVDCILRIPGWGGGDTINLAMYQAVGPGNIGPGYTYTTTQGHYIIRLGHMDEEERVVGLTKAILNTISVAGGIIGCQANKNNI